MIKTSLLACITAVGIAGCTVLPVQAAEESAISWELGNGKGYIVAGEQVCSPEEIKELLKELCNCFPNIDIPDNNQPGDDIEAPDNNQPGNDTETPDNNQPGTDTETPDNNQPGNDTETPAFSYAEQVVKLVNEERAKVGAGALTLDKEIEAAALARAKEIETSFSHTRPDGRNFSTALTDAGITFRSSGENIAWGQRSPEEVVKAWMNSEGHRANILNTNFTKIGVGYYQNGAGRNYWSQLFTN
ncbi:MAG: hypothetical protein GX284_07335 [Clostridiales bacterium]|nr:hypothetical protein [Clostridiales bacterium]